MVLASSRKEGRDPLDNGTYVATEGRAICPSEIDAGMGGEDVIDADSVYATAP